MTDSILELMKAAPKHPWSVREILVRLKLHNSEKTKLKRTLSYLTKDGQLMRLRGNKYLLPQHHESLMLTGLLKVHRDGYGFVLPEKAGEKDVFIPARFMANALPGDKVRVKYTERTLDGKREGRIMEVLERGRSRWVGVLEKKGSTFYVTSREISDQMPIFIHPALLNGAHVGQTVVARVTEYPDAGEEMEGQIERVLGAAHDEKTEMAAVLVRHNIPENFPDEVLKEAESFTAEISSAERRSRVDLTDLPILTIDGQKARDFDDAVFVTRRGKFWHLYVAIADVAHYVTRGSLTDKEAFSRGTSVYFPDFAIPMLPEILSNDLCSLKPGLERRTLTCEMKINDKGELAEAWYYESIIKSQKRGIYEDVQSFFDGDLSEDEHFGPELIKSLHEMKKLAVLLMKQRKKRGSLDFDLPEAELVYNHEGRIETIQQAKRFFSHKLIEEFMILANVAVATLFTCWDVPALYRVHDFPDSDKLENLLFFIRNLGVKISQPHLRHPKDFARLLEDVQGHPMETLIHQLLLRSMKWAVYAPQNVGHFGLSLKDYSHFTSPIRRYPDLIVHRQLKGLIEKSKDGKLHLIFGGSSSTRGKKVVETKKTPTKFGKKMYTAEMLETQGKHASQREREAMEAEREVMDLKRVIFMQDHLGERFFGIVRRVAKFGLFVELDPHFVEGLLHVQDLGDDYYYFDERKLKLVGKRNKKEFQVGDRVTVRVKDISMDQRQIMLSYEPEEDHNFSFGRKKGRGGRK